MKKFRVVELYAGTGRSVEPFKHWRRAELALLVDASDHERNTYLSNFPNAPYVRRDISRLQPEELLRLAGGRVDILLGCPPCQGFSESGLRRSDDPRNRHVQLTGVHLKNMERSPVTPLENIHPFGLGEFARATQTVALRIIALGTGHRRREAFFQPRLGLRHGSRRWLVTKVCADRLWSGQSRKRVALRAANGCFEISDIAGAGPGQCIGSGESEYRANKSRCYLAIGHTEHPAVRGGL